MSDSERVLKKIVSRFVGYHEDDPGLPLVCRQVLKVMLAEGLLVKDEWGNYVDPGMIPAK